MNEELDQKIKAVEGKGLKRILIIFKLCLKEMPRLIQALESKDPPVQKKAVFEARALIDRFDEELKLARTNEGLKIEEFNAALNSPEFFTENEWKHAAALPILVRKYKHLLNPPVEKKKKNTFRYPKA